MATVASRLSSTGTLFISGEFNEVTTATIRLTTATQYAAQFNEVTYNTTSPVIKNLLTSSQELNNWGTFLNIVTADQTTAPDGTLTAERIQIDPTGYTAQINITTTIGTIYTFSLWVKSYSGSTGTWGINWYSGVHHRTTVPITGDWARQSITFTADATQINVYVGDNRSALASITDGYVWGAQLEISSIPTIYQGITLTGTLISPNFAKRETSDGILYVTNQFDEVNKPT